MQQGHELLVADREDDAGLVHHEIVLVYGFLVSIEHTLDVYEASLFV